MWYPSQTLEYHSAVKTEWSTSALSVMLKNILLRERSQVQNRTYGEVLEEAKLVYNVEIRSLIFWGGKRKSLLGKAMRDLSGRCYKCSLSWLGCFLHGVNLSQTINLNRVHFIVRDLCHDKVDFKIPLK